MFGVAGIRTRSEQMELAHSGMPHRSSNDTGAESALLRTRALLEGTINQQQHVMSAVRLPSDLKADELAALSVLRSVLIGLESCILEHDNPPPTVSKRKVLIKVEKARREVLAAVRECGCRVVESQKLFEEVERFIELRPDEVVSPRSLNIKWNRQAPARPAPRQRDQAFGRNFRPGDSLIASIVGLSAIAEGRERDTPTADVGGPTAAFGPCQPTDKPQLHDVLLQPHGYTKHPRSEQDYAPTTERPLGALRDGAEARAADGGSRSVSNGEATAAVQAQTAVQAAKEAVLAMRKLQLQPRLADSLVGRDDDLRPSLSHDIAPSSSTTMCNMDSCVSGPNRGPTGEADAGNRRSYACDEEEEEDDDEVNSAEGRCYEAGSPGHRVSLLGQRGPSAAARAAALVQSTAGTALGGRGAAHPSDVAAAPQAAAAASLASLAMRGGGGLDGDAVVAADVDTAAAKPVATATSPAPRSAKAAQGSQEPMTADRSYIAAEPRRRHSGANPGPAPPLPNQLPPQHPQPHQQHPQLTHHTGVNVPPGGAIDARSDGYQVAAAELDAIGLIAATPAQQQQHPQHPPPRYATRRHQPAAPAAGAAADAAYPHHHHHAMPQAAAAQAAASLAPQAHPHPHPQPPVGVQHHHQQQQPSVYSQALYPPPPPLPPAYQHPALAAAVAAAAAHPYNANGFPHPYLGLMNGGGGGAYSLPPSVPSSLRDFPIAGPLTRPGTAGGAAAAPAGPVRYGSQPPSGYPSLDSGQYPASTPWDNVSLADTEPLPGAGVGNGRRGRRGGRRKGGGLFGLVRNVVGFVGVSMLSGAAMVLGAAAVNTGLDEQEASQQARQRPGAQQSGARRTQRLGRGGDDLIPQRTLQQLRSPDLLALGRG